MFGSSIKIGRIFGIPIGVHYTWFIVFILITGILGSNYFPSEFPRWSGFQTWGVAILTSLLFFASVLAHELGHSLVAKRYDIGVKSITLFVFGGVAQIAKDPPRPKVEALIALAGPLVSLTIGGIFLGIYFAASDRNDSIAGLAYYLGSINIMVATFNMIPGFPLDGGRVFRAIVWAVKGNFVSATRFATTVGRGVGYLFIFIGVIRAFWYNDLSSGLWIAFIGWFLENAASQSYAQVAIRQALEGIYVREVMSRDTSFIFKRIDLQTLIDSYINFSGKRFFLVGEAEKWEGVLSLQDIRKVSREKRRETRVADVMVPVGKVATVKQSDELLKAIEIMDNADVNQVPVLDGERVVGVLSRENIVRLLRSRAELKAGA
ncbi:MAG: site-2 protease family protein [Chloroflexi bacterium]|nr:site-2 protease family protein [Chloroflexota bacterium]